MSNKRGRPPANKTQEQVDNSRVDIEVSREDVAHSAKRPARVRMAVGQTLNVDNKDPNYVYRWFKDNPGRIEQAQAAYWDFVKKDGTKDTRPSGPFTMYLMRIEKKYWEEDQLLKQTAIIDTMKKQNKMEEGEYLPDGHHHALQKDDYDPLT